jgi:hypothetical protein
VAININQVEKEVNNLTTKVALLTTLISKLEKISQDVEKAGKENAEINIEKIKINKISEELNQKLINELEQQIQLLNKKLEEHLKNTTNSIKKLVPDLSEQLEEKNALFKEQISVELSELMTKKLKELDKSVNLLANNTVSNVDSNLRLANKTTSDLKVLIKEHSDDTRNSINSKINEMKKENTKKQEELGLTSKNISRKINFVIASSLILLATLVYSILF